MANLVIDKLGYIKGGRCDQMHKNRRARESESRHCINWLISEGYIVKSKGWYKAKKEPRIGWRAIEAHAGQGAHSKIGWYRVLQEILPRLIKKGMSFRLKWIYKWGEDISSFEFMMGCESPVPTKEHPLKLALGPPHHDLMYQKRKTRGDF